ncbi:MAG: ABC-type branched-chain amino acid transport system, ATPase component [Rhizobacter sp.]|nr:ABC-type branched-chain amino acid transport system, ATPase component [Rhizobacter sp.]
MLSARNLSVQFGGLRAVDDVSFHVRPGEIFTLCGPNGAGKTTIFNLVSRLYDPSAGQIVFEGRDITRMPAHQVARIGIARTFQNIELFGGASVLTNLLLGADVQRRTTLIEELFFMGRAARQEAALREKVEEVIEFLGLQRFRDTAIQELSYGVRKEVELARALSLGPRLVLLDEPSSGLNDQETELVGYWIGRIRRDRGVTVIMVEHDMSLVSAVSDRVLVMEAGRVLAEGTPAEIQADPAVIRAYLGE